jgi:hypothetical protein
MRAFPIVPIVLTALAIGGFTLNGTSALAEGSASINGLQIILHLPKGTNTLVFSNVWIKASNSISEEAFWLRQGFTNKPISLNVPGGAPGGPWYFLFVGRGQVLPFVERIAGDGRPDGIWSVAVIPVEVNGLVEERSVSECNSIDFLTGPRAMGHPPGKLAMSSRSKKWNGFVTWALWSESNGSLHIEITWDISWG